jgi:hypothetical protein
MKATRVLEQSSLNVGYKESSLGPVGPSSRASAPAVDRCRYVFRNTCVTLSRVLPLQFSEFQTAFQYTHLFTS